MRSAMMALLVLTLPYAGSAAVWVVDQGGHGDFVKIQDAIDTASPGDEILVHDGVYLENLDFLGKDIWVRSASGPSETVINGDESEEVLDRSCAVFRSGESESAILEGFTLSKGEGTWWDEAEAHVGGGVFTLESSPTIRDCWFIGNAAVSGAGLYISQGATSVIDCRFQFNEAVSNGGGIAGSGFVPSLIKGCHFEGNTCGWLGGGLHLRSASTIMDCVFVDNIGGMGGGLTAPNVGADFHIKNCYFEGNHCTDTHGGGIRIHEASPTVEYCVFVNNTSVQDGGGIMAYDGGSPVIRYCTFYKNGADRYGGNIAVWYDSSPDINNCIIAEAQHGGVFCFEASPAFQCNDVWQNAGGDYSGQCADQTGENGNIAADPLFCDAGAGDLTLQAGSPCAPENSAGCGLIGALGVGCETVSVSDPRTLARRMMPAGPNPFSGSLRIWLPDSEAGRGGAPLRLEVYAPTGQRIWSDDRLARSLVTWNGRDAKGRSVAGGTYLLRLVQGDKVVATRNVIKLK